MTQYVLRSECQNTLQIDTSSRNVMTNLFHCFPHNFWPSFLSENLKHGEECVWEHVKFAIGDTLQMTKQLHRNRAHND